MAKSEFAPGLPDPRRFGRVRDLPTNKELLWVIQKHLAERAGPHFDIRLGPRKGTLPTLLSWATRKLPTKPGQKILAFQQPLHTGDYADFEGKIVSGYGKGTVTTHDKGAVLVTKVEPDKINFAVIHRKHPETFTLIRKSGPPKVGTSRTRASQGGTWLMINTTPTEVIKHKKVHYTKVPQEDVEKLFSPEYLHEEKLDGAAALYKLFSDKIEILSYRPTTKGRPIVHSYRVGNTTGLNIPKHLVGSVLRGEIYGVRKPTGEAIPSQELGGILNAATQKSLAKQREQKVELRNAVFNILQYGKKKVPIKQPLAERMTMLKEVLGYLPEKKFHLPRMAETPEAQRKLWEEITSGKYPMTREGIVAWPVKGGKPTKVKLYDEHDVHVRDIFPGEGELAGVGAGGFKYSIEPGGPVVGEVGTGFTRATREEMFQQPEEYIGRVARIRAQEQFPGGAYRAPSFIALHEDYPGAKKSAGLAGPALLAAGLIGPSLLGKVLKRMRVKRLTEAAGKPADYGSYVAIRSALDAGNIPHIIAREANVSPALRATVGPETSAYLFPENPLSYFKAWLSKQSDFADLAKRHGAIISEGPLPTGYFAHELSHGTGLGTSPLYRKAVIGTSEAHKLGKPLGALVGAIAALAGKKPGLAAALGATAGAVPHIPQLFEESRANLRALGALRGSGLPGAGDLGISEAEYLTPAIGSAMTGAGTALTLKNILTMLKKLKKGASVESERVLAPLIKQALSDMGLEGDTLGDLVKHAKYVPPSRRKPPEMPESLQRALGKKPSYSAREHLLGAILGIDPVAVRNLSGAASRTSSFIEWLKSFSKPSLRPIGMHDPFLPYRAER